MGKHPADDVAEINAVEREIDTLRLRTEDLLAELERRVETKVGDAKHAVARVQNGLQRAREYADVPAQVRAHPRVAAGIGVGALAAVGLGLWAYLARRAEERRLVNRVRRRAHAYRALLADPERALAPRGPSISRRLLAAVLVAAATTLTKRLVTRAVQMR